MGLGGFGCVDSVEADDYLPSGGAANAKGIPAGDLYDAARECLPGFYGHVFLGLPAGRSCGEGEKKRA